jgi:hypothetical protein
VGDAAEERPAVKRYVAAYEVLTQTVLRRASMNEPVTKPVFEVLACDDTELGLLILRRRELIGRRGTIVTEITLNHEFLMSDYLTLSERALARSALLRHDGSDLRVLVGGLGLGYTANEVLVAGGDSADFYTEAGLRRAREHLSESGVLAVWSYAEDSPFATAMRDVFGDVCAEPITVENDLVDEEQTDWLFIAR